MGALLRRARRRRQQEEARARTRARTRIRTRRRATMGRGAAAGRGGLTFDRSAQQALARSSAVWSQSNSPDQHTGLSSPWRAVGAAVGERVSRAGRALDSNDWLLTRDKLKRFIGVRGRGEDGGSREEGRGGRSKSVPPVRQRRADALDQMETGTVGRSSCHSSCKSSTNHSRSTVRPPKSHPQLGGPNLRIHTYRIPNLKARSIGSTPFGNPT